ncbi:MAG: hypothetical protein AAF215_20710 [Cyanobacteria bacterium P01_A01_bin.123]
MLATFTVVGFFFAWAGIQQYFLNQMIKADNEYLRKLCAKSTDDWTNVI